MRGLAWVTSVGAGTRLKSVVDPHGVFGWSPTPPAKVISSCRERKHAGETPRRVIDAAFSFAGEVHAKRPFRVDMARWPRRRGTAAIRAIAAVHCVAGVAECPVRGDAPTLRREEGWRRAVTCKYLDERQ